MSSGQVMSGDKTSSRCGVMSLMIIPPGLWNDAAVGAGLVAEIDEMYGACSRSARYGALVVGTSGAMSTSEGPPRAQTNG